MKTSLIHPCLCWFGIKLPTDNSFLLNSAIYYLWSCLYWKAMSLYFCCMGVTSGFISVCIDFPLASPLNKSLYVPFSLYLISRPDTMLPRLGIVLTFMVRCCTKHQPSMMMLVSWWPWCQHICHILLFVLLIWEARCCYYWLNICFVFLELWHGTTCFSYNFLPVSHTKKGCLYSIIDQKLDCRGLGRLPLTNVVIIISTDLLLK